MEAAFVESSCAFHQSNTPPCQGAATHAVLTETYTSVSRTAAATAVLPDEEGARGIVRPVFCAQHAAQVATARNEGVRKAKAARAVSQSQPKKGRRKPLLCPRCTRAIPVEEQVNAAGEQREPRCERCLTEEVLAPLPAKKPRRKKATAA